MRILVLFIAVFVSNWSFSQDVEVLLKQADNFDKQVKEQEAIDKYKEVLAVDSLNFRALYRLTELNAGIGTRQPKDKDKLPWFQQAWGYAQTASRIDTSDQAYYLLALANWKMATVEEKNKEEAAHLKNWKEYAEKARTTNPKNARAAFLLGKWHFYMTTSSLLKKAAAKTIYAGMGKWDIETAIKLFEESRRLDQYFVQNFYELALAYQYNNQPTQQIEVLNRLVKLPVRTADDPGWKAEGKKMLEQMK